MTKHIIAPGGELKGEFRVESDKSITHRAFLIASMAREPSEVIAPLMSADTRASLDAAKVCGADVKESGEGFVISGGELHAPNSESGIIDCGNAGTLIRIFCGIAAGWNVQCKLTGDESLMSRPMRRVVWPLRDMGANIDINAEGTPPVVINKQKTLTGAAHQIKIASAQVKSALLLAGLRARGQTSVQEPVMSRDHTERMLECFGVKVHRDGLLTAVDGGAVLRGGASLHIPADMSSAAFFMAAAAMTPGSDLLLTDVGVNAGRFGVVDILRRMGADVDILNPRQFGGEPVADIRIFGGELRGVEIGADVVPSAVDDLPVLLVAAAVAEGETILTGAGELRHKESDRLAAVYDGLTALGVSCKLQEDGIIVRGGGGFGGGEIESCGDHRIAMAFSMAALRAKGEIIVNDCDNVQTSFPSFVATAQDAGLRITSAAAE
ncbi:MAG: 3-phosphoshikimate 1-carboxyvinyltransferase [Gammaproteobacteria bacterium]